MRTLQRLKVTNFKSIREQELRLGPLNVFIGGNGSGKSNLINVFRFLKEIVSQNLSGYTQLKGGADSLLYYGRKRSPGMELDVEFGAGSTTNRYLVSLTGTDDDSLFIAKELAYYHDKAKYPTTPYNQLVASGTRESALKKTPHICSRQILADLEGYRVYHFHDTSDTVPTKGLSDVEDNRFLRPQAENLAAFLYLLQEQKPQHFSLIQDTIRQIAPFFGKFQLAPSRLSPSKIRLEWQERGSDAYFNASSLSDGTLRFICLSVLLLQPDLPSLVLLDEPELGLHPAAITLLANMLSSAAKRAQVIVATQSVTLVNQFTPEEVWTVDREEGQSVFRQLNSADRSDWLENYALGELWEKNLLGARP
jgi:predicted ATPase